MGPSENYVNQSLGKLPNLQGCGIIAERSEEVAEAEASFGSLALLKNNKLIV